MEKEDNRRDAQLEEEGDGSSNTRRDVLAEKRTRRIDADAAVASRGSGRMPLGSISAATSTAGNPIRGKQESFDIFVDENDSSSNGKGGEREREREREEKVVWPFSPPEKAREREKENVQTPSMWAGETLAQKEREEGRGRVGGARDFVIFTEEEEEAKGERKNARYGERRKKD